jgi:hypothetical protein
VEAKFYGAFASTSTPSTRRLLDGVAMPEHPTHWLIPTQVHAHVVQQLVHVQLIIIISRLIHEMLVRRRRRLQLEHFGLGNLLIGPSHLVQYILVDT